MRNVLFLSAISLFAFSCEKEIPLDQEEIEPRIVVNGIFEAGDTIEIQVSESRSVLWDSTLPYLDNAVAKLYDSNDNFLGDFTNYASGLYRLENYLPIVGASYKIKVTHTGFNDVSSETYTPTPIAIQSIDTLRKGDFMTYEIKFNDDPAADNYYAVTIDRTSSYEDPFTGEIIYYSDPAYYTSEIYTENGIADVDGTKWGTMFLFSDATFSGGTCSFSAENYVSADEDSLLIFIGVRSLSEDYFKYALSRQKYNETEGDPFAQPVQVYSNIENGFGIFGGYSVSRDTILIE